MKEMMSESVDDVKRQLNTWKEILQPLHQLEVQRLLELKKRMFTSDTGNWELGDDDAEKLYFGIGVSIPPC